MPFAGTAWLECDSWYRDESGRIVTNWPGYMRDYAERATNLDPDDYGFVRPRGRASLLTAAAERPGRSGEEPGERAPEFLAAGGPEVVAGHLDVRPVRQRGGELPAVVGLVVGAHDHQRRRVEAGEPSAGVGTALSSTRTSAVAVAAGLRHPLPGQPVRAAELAVVLAGERAAEGQPARPAGRVGERRQALPAERRPGRPARPARACGRR